MNTNQEIAREILESIVSQITTTMIGDLSPLTKSGLTELMQRIILANEMLDQ